MQVSNPPLSSVRAAVARLKAYHPGSKAPHTVKLSSNENPLGPSPLALQAYTEIAGTLHRYPDGAATELRAALARYHGLKPEQIIVGNGSDELMTLIAAAYIDPGNVVSTAQETFSQYAYASMLFDGSLHETPLRDGCYNLEAMATLYDTTACKLVFVCNPNNPTGTYRTHDDIRAFLERTPPETVVVLDEAYAEYATAPDFPRFPELIAAHPNLVVLRTFSKLYGLAGLRVGYGMGDPALIESIARVKQPFNVGLASQAAAAAAVLDTQFREASLRLNAEGRLWYEQELGALGLAFYRTQANFLCINVLRPAEEAVRTLERHGVSVRNLASFGLPHSIRVTIGRPEDNAKVMQGLTALRP